jgi:hypothetical protein
MATDNSKAATTPTNNDGWEDVISESQYVFESFGDEFIGKLLGWSESANAGIPQAHFENATGKYFVNCGWSLKQQLKAVKVGTECRIVYVSDHDTGKESPMMIFKVQTRRTTK